jgi:hypothetical protein
VYLDVQVDLTATTTATLPADYPISSTLTAVQGAGCPNPGMRIIITDNTAGVLTLAEDMLGGTIHVGVMFLSKYVPTQYFVKDGKGNTVSTGNLRIQKFYLSFENTGALEAYADSRFSGTYSLFDFSGRVVGSIDNVLGSQPIVTDTFVVPFRFKSDEADLRIETDTHLPFTLVDLEWVGKYTKRGRRL